MEVPIQRPTFWEAFRFWLKLGFVSFGGPAGQIAILHTELVEKRRWISESRFLHALNFCMLLPGPEAQQLATYLGWLLHGVRGGIAAGALFILPAVVILWALSWVYAVGGSVPWIAAVFYGLQPAVLAIVAAAVIRMGGKALRGWALRGIALFAFVLIFWGNAPIVLILLAAALLGLLAAKKSPAPSESSTFLPISKIQLAVMLIVGLLLWWGPILLVGMTFGWQSLFFQQGVFFSKAALITFGGAYAVLPYVAQQAVEHFGWLQPDQMIAGLALAETTPGPLIIVLQFVGFIGAWQHPGSLPPLAAGTLGAAITTWSTFLPSFLFVFAGAPLMERLQNSPRLSAALSGITAAVVGVMLNLAIWFGWHILLPQNGKFDWVALAMSALFFIGLRFGKWTPIPVVVAGGILGVMVKWLAGF